MRWCPTSFVFAGIVLATLSTSATAKLPSVCDAVDHDDVCAGPIALDFDGDGIADSLTLISARGPIGMSTGTTVISNLWGPRIKDAKVAVMAIGLGKPRRGYLLVDQSGFFDTPIWKHKPLPLEVAKRGSKTFNEFQSQEKSIKNDILVLGTEAGIDIALYWNGKTFALFQPAEEP